ncbi:LptF/LptG family permease, partial [bacterium AH-315-C07]|nr:LptF/LptG family permease [bacterium AH-315-C07]
NWTIRNYTIREFKDGAEKISHGTRIDTTFNFKPEDFARRINEITTMNDSELAEFINEERSRGADNIEFYLVEKHKRYAMPFATIVLTLIGVSLSSMKKRGGIGIYLGVGIGSAFAYILLMQVSTTFATNSGFSPFLAVWIPNILFTIYGLYLLRVAPK